MIFNIHKIRYESDEKAHNIVTILARNTIKNVSELPEDYPSSASCVINVRTTDVNHFVALT